MTDKNPLFLTESELTLLYQALLKFSDYVDEQKTSTAGAESNYWRARVGRVMALRRKMLDAQKPSKK